MLHKIGDTLCLSGEVKFGGESRLLFGWTAASRLKGSGVDYLLACALSFDETCGKTFVTARAAPEAQSAWMPCVAALDIRLKSPDGYVRHSGQARIELAEPITE